MLIQLDIDEDQYTLVLTYKELEVLHIATSNTALVDLEDHEQGQLALRMHRMLQSALTLSNQGDSNG